MEHGVCITCATCHVQTLMGSGRLVVVTNHGIGRQRIAPNVAPRLRIAGKTAEAATTTSRHALDVTRLSRSSRGFFVLPAYAMVGRPRRLFRAVWPWRCPQTMCGILGVRLQINGVAAGRWPLAAAPCGLVGRRRVEGRWSTVAR
jgi:hypothetical protein